MEQNENGTIGKKEKRTEPEGPCSRTEWNIFKKVGTCPALATGAHCEHDSDQNPHNTFRKYKMMNSP